MKIEKLKNGCVISLSQYLELFELPNLSAEQKTIRKDGLIQICLFEIDENKNKIETTKKCIFVDTNS